MNLTKHCIKREQVYKAAEALLRYANNEHPERFKARVVLLDMLYLVGQELHPDFKGDASAFDRFKNTLREVLS